MNLIVLPIYFFYLYSKINNIFFASQIYCSRPIVGIFYLDLIQKPIVTDLKLTISIIFLLATFFLYLKLSYISINLLLKACSLINTVLEIIILISFPKKILYKTNKLNWLRKVIPLTQALVEYQYIIIRRKI